MTTMLELIAPLAALTVFAFLAARFGRDSRDGVAALPQPALGLAQSMSESWQNMAHRR